MDFTNEFSVDAPVATVWSFMIQAEQVAPCVPGAAITEQIDETHFRGTVTIKLGAVQMTYRGELEMQPDETGRTITLSARGSDVRGGGGASGNFVTTLAETPSGGTAVHIQSHVDVTGRVATFGRGIMQDVANRLIKEFAACLERKLQTSSPAPSEEARDVDAVAPPAVQPQEVIAISPPSAPVPPTSEGPAELKVGKLIADLTRSRVALGLRRLADLVEPE